ncbi:unnamed protein product [Cladocopium goreaui]|uniref:Uncharacterized protein n=1 Tax=Cladocopium goreaui TaxID=2562237 RepID=A0A9P1GCL0_9DINO|nr:unnamed protein product [Cladocopium goreaui]
MGLYGAKSCKATQLFGSSPMIMDFETHMPKPKRDELQLSSKGMVKKTISKSDPNKVWVSGDVGLRESQAYPKKFAQTCLNFFKKQDASVAGLLPKVFDRMQQMHPEPFVP